ncbi:MAG: HAMP domain-containing sensor histidine kinase [Candidatus Paceibacterota bacterium]|jgi:two-component system phosphate regulon sensor histidine kinase PhoR
MGLDFLIKNGNELLATVASADYWRDFSSWLALPLALVLTTVISLLIWHRQKKADLLKYEFITVVAHKFRTPLTYIKWSAENLALSNDPAERKRAVDEILTANARLVELTNALSDLSMANGASYFYKSEKIEPRKLIDSVLGTLDYQIKKKKIDLHIRELVTSRIVGDFRRLTFALGIVVENAVMYTPAGGSIGITVSQSDKLVSIAVKDSGVGISREELSAMFSKFFRGAKAKQIDSGGVGIGLFMAKKIVEKNGGQIEVFSEGVGKGATFAIKLPAVK